MKYLLPLLLLVISACTELSTDDYISNAQKYIHEEDYPPAMIELKNAVKKSPSNAQARFLLGMVYFKQKQYLSAEKELRIALKNSYPMNEVTLLLSKNYRQSHTDLALIKLAHNDASMLPVQSAQIAFYKVEAYFVLNKVAEANEIIAEFDEKPMDSIYDGLINVYAFIIKNEANTALQKIDAILADYPDQLDALTLKATILTDSKLTSSKSNLITDIYQRIYLQSPEDEENAFRLARQLVVTGETKKAEVIVDSLLKTHPKVSLLNVIKGVARYHEEDYENALKYLELALNNNVADLTTSLLAGYSAFKLEKFDKANSYLSMIADKLPASHNGLRVLAISQLKLGLYNDAHNSIAQIDNLTEKDASLLRYVGMSLISAGERTKAKALLSEYEAKQTNETMMDVAQLKLSLNDISGIGDIEKIVSLDNSNSLSNNAILATAYINTGQYEKALTLAKKWQKQADKFQGFMLEGIVNEKLKVNDKALTAFNKAVTLSPNNEAANIALINLLYVVGQKSTAKSHLSKYLKAHPRSSSALAKQYLFAKAEGDSQGVIRHIVDLVSANPEDKSIRLLLAKIQYTEKEYHKVVNLLAGRGDLLGATSQYWELLGESYLLTSQLKKAITHYDSWLVLRPNNRKAILGKLTILDRFREYKQAITLSNTYLDKMGKDSQIQLLEIHFLLLTNQSQSAKIKLNGLPEEIKKQPFYLGIIGHLSLLKQDYQAALPNLLIAYRDTPTSLWARLIAQSYYKLGKTKQGYDFLVQHVDNHPSDLAIVMLLANQQMNMDPELAIESYKSALKISEKNVIALNNLANIYLQQNEVKNAELYITKALALQPQNIYILDTMAQVQNIQGNYKQALIYLNKAVNNNKVSDEVYLNYLVVLLNNDQKILAIKKMSERNFQDPKVQGKLLQLKKRFNL